MQRVVGWAFAVVTVILIFLTLTSVDTGAKVAAGGVIAGGGGLAFVVNRVGQVKKEYDAARKEVAARCPATAAAELLLAD
jgi:hypothetical protein